jgi:hypothetical protein
VTTHRAAFPQRLDDLRELALGPFAAERASPLAPAHAVVIGTDLLAQLDTAHDGDAIARGLIQLSCPVLAVAAGRAGFGTHDACDVVLPVETEVEAILTNIGRCPIAATVLVQVLRATPALSVSEGLKLESLAYATLQSGPEHTAWLAAKSPSGASVAGDHGPPVLVESNGGQLSLTLNRPARHNALSVELRDALCEALQLVLADPTIEAVSVSGAGRCFSIGGDLDEFGTAPDPATAHIVRSVRQPALLLSRCADRVDFALHGACIGAGMELPAFGRRIVAARNSFFQLPELRFGLIPGAGGCVSIPRRIGRHRTAYLALSGRRIGAARALNWGLVDAFTD